ncbi:MAG: YbjN domain-containing protein [Oscillospiraceae bacterium]|nr:YbjN domain-containing protein [Oscillospiraceae bacterium]
MDYQKLIKLLKEKLTENNFSDFTVEKDINHNYIFMIPVSDFDIGILISESGSIFFECQLASEVQKSKRITILETLNDLNFKYSINLVLDENDDIYLKYVCIICGDETTACKQIFTMLEFFITMIENCIDDIMCFI